VLVLEILLALAAAAAVGWLRPRWSTASAAVVPTALAFAWLLLHEDVPGDPITLDDLVWYLGMSLVPGAAFALACCLGVAARRASARRRALR
jgi:hypothetical protein